MMQGEYFDIYNEDMEKTGVELRSIVHKKGLWHKTFQCWFMAKEGDKTYIYFQKRHEEKDTYPNLLDITAAGHLSIGEDITEGVREIEEELGIKVAFHELKAIGILKEKKLEEDFIDAEFAHVFIYSCSTPMDQFNIQKDEVVGIFRADLNDIIKLFKYMKRYAEVEGYEVDNRGEKHHIRLRVEVKDFVPHKPAYYMQVFSEIKNYDK